VEKGKVGRRLEGGKRWGFEGGEGGKKRFEVYGGQRFVVLGGGVGMGWMVGGRSSF
jgi:hypothetical protein